MMESIIVFPDTNSAIAAEQYVLGVGLRVSVMPLPESIGMGCGITLRIDEDSLPVALGILQENGVAVSDVYSREKTHTGFKYTKRGTKG